MYYRGRRATYVFEADFELTIVAQDGLKHAALLLPQTPHAGLTGLCHRAQVYLLLGAGVCQEWWVTVGLA